MKDPFDYDEDKLRVWWIPQVPLPQEYERFEVYVNTIEEAYTVYEILARYDLYQLETNIKPDYCNVGGVEGFDKEMKEWIDWWSDDGLEFEEYVNEVLNKGDS